MEERTKKIIWPLAGVAAMMLVAGIIVIKSMNTGEFQIDESAMNAGDDSLPAKTEIGYKIDRTEPALPDVERGSLPQRRGAGELMIPTGSEGYTGAASGDEAARRTSNYTRPAGVTAEQKAKEEAFIRAHAEEIAAYQEKIKNIGGKYYKKYAVVREIDSEFGKLDRFMALKAKYEKDRDPYAWARAAIALPEVKQAIVKYAANPMAWKAAIEMVSEVFKTAPPPTSLYKETMRFLSQDPGMSKYVGELNMEITPKAMKVLPFAMPAGTDITSLQKIATDVTTTGK